MLLGTEIGSAKGLNPPPYLSRKHLDDQGCRRMVPKFGKFFEEERGGSRPRVPRVGEGKTTTNGLVSGVFKKGGGGFRAWKYGVGPSSRRV